MILAPPLSVRNIHLITQHIPHRTRLLARGQCLYHRHGIQSQQGLIARQTSSIAPAEHFFKQFPKFTFLHGL